MKQLMLAAAALFAAIFISGNAEAITGSAAKSLQAASYAMKAKHGCCRQRGCGSCGSYRYTVYPSCGRYDLYNYTVLTGCGYGYSNYRCGCACSSCSCGYRYGGCGYRPGWGRSGWFY